ncbi:MAG: sulfatase-like hydrolase/transferase, partial [Planctomycetes bacterium]|nr:sulfatase-like hydrolase/transferase [Planctomycetota bacterium]
YGTHNFRAAARNGKPDGTPSVWDVPGLEEYHGQDVFLTEALAQEAVLALRDASDTGKPFFLNFCPYAVHVPIMANKRWLDHYPDLDPREAAYATMVESYDHALGALMTELERLDIAQNTLIVFASDNGGLSAHGRGGAPHVHNAPLKSGKGSAYEGGIRVPTMILWPGVAPSGLRVETPISSPDLFATLLAAANAKPADLLETRDGRDLSPLLAREAAPFEDRMLGWHQPHQWGVKGPGIEPFTAIRQGDWKLIWFHADSRFELYNLAEDLGETRNLAESQPNRLAHMIDLMREWLDSRDAQMSIDKLTGQALPLPECGA